MIILLTIFTLFLILIFYRKQKINIEKISSYFALFTLFSLFLSVLLFAIYTFFSKSFLTLNGFIYKVSTIYIFSVLIFIYFILLNSKQRNNL